MKSILTILASVGVLAFNLVTGIIVAKLLGPEDRGLLASTQSICLLIANFTSLSIADTFARDLAARGDRGFAIAGVHMQLMILGSTVGLLVLFVLYELGLFLLPGSTPLLTAGLFLLIPLLHLSQIGMGVLQARQEWNAWNIIRLLPHMMFLVVLLAFTTGEASAETVARLFVIANLAPLLVTILLVARTDVSWRSRVREPFVPIARAAIALHSSRALQMSRVHLDKIIVPLIFGPKVLGYYLVASTLASPIHGITTALASTFLPRITAAVRNRDAINMRRILLEVAFLNLVGITLCIFYVRVSQRLLPLVFGEEFAPAIAYMPFVIAFTAAYSISKLIDTFLLALNRARMVFLIEILPVVSIVVGLLLFQESFFGFLWFMVITALAGTAIYVIMFVRFVLPALPWRS
jgi:O-antigen/teichoic acid export membrane protein